MKSRADLTDWFDIDAKRKKIEDVVRDWDKNHEGPGHDGDRAERTELERQIAEMKAELERRKHEAWTRGDGPVQKQNALGAR